MNKSFFKYQIILNFLLIAICGKVYGQQVPLNNHYIINPFVLNPAEAGANENTNIYLIRNQRFGGFESANINNYLTADGRIMKGKGGLGFQLAQQQHGIQQQISSSLSYSYGVQLFPNHFLRLGVSAGLLDNRIDKAAINVLQPDDPYLVSMRSNGASFDLSAGLLYTFKKLKVGFSVPQLLANKVSFDTSKSRGYYRLSRHFMGLIQYDFKLGEKFTLTPNALVRFAPGAPIQYDLTAQVKYLNKYWASATYKSDYALQFNVGFQLLQHLKLGYSYELVTGSIKNYTTAIHHEILIGYTFKGSNKTTQHVSIASDTIYKTVILKDELQEARVKELEERLKKSTEDRDYLVQELILKNRETDSYASTVKQDTSEVRKDNDTTIIVETEEQIKDNDLIRDSEFYNFIELDASKSPDGYYVISGVFSSKKNAQKEIERIKLLEPTVYMIISTSNNFYYLVTLLTEDRDLALEKCKASRVEINKNTWIINYRKN